MKPSDIPGPAWFRHRMHAGQKVRVFIRGWFTPLHGEVLDVVENRVLIGSKWVTLSGTKRDVVSVELCLF